MRKSYKNEQSKDIDKFLSVLMQEPSISKSQKPEGSTVRTNYLSNSGEEYQIYGV